MQHQCTFDISQKNRNPQKIETNHTSTRPVFICTFSYILFRSVNKENHSKYIAVPPNGKAARDSLHFCYKKVTSIIIVLKYFNVPAFLWGNILIKL